MYYRNNPTLLCDQMNNHRVSIRTECVELMVASVVDTKGNRSDFLLISKSCYNSQNMGGPRKRTKLHKFDSL